jgi:hypothetical protein
MNITNKKTIEDLPDEFGGDATFEIIEEDNVENLFEEENHNYVSTKEDHHARSATSNELVGSPLYQEVSNSSQNKNDWSSYKPGDIKNAPSKKLRFKTDTTSSVGNSYSYELSVQTIFGISFFKRSVSKKGNRNNQFKRSKR